MPQFCTLFNQSIIRKIIPENTGNDVEEIEETQFKHGTNIVYDEYASYGSYKGNERCKAW